MQMGPGLIPHAKDPLSGPTREMCVRKPEGVAPGGEISTIRLMGDGQKFLSVQGRSGVRN